MSRRGDPVLVDQAGSVDGEVRDGVVPLRIWEGVEEIRDEVGEIDEGDLRGEVMDEFRRNGKSVAMRGEVDRHDVDGKGNREASDLLGDNLVDCLWNCNRESKVLQVLRLSLWEGNILARIRWMKRLIEHKSNSVMSRSCRDDRRGVSSCPSEILDVARFEDGHCCIHFRSCVLIPSVGMYCGILNRVHQIPSTISLIDQRIYLLLWLSYTFDSISTLDGVCFQVERSCPSMKFQEQSTCITQCGS